MKLQVFTTRQNTIQVRMMLDSQPNWEIIKEVPFDPYRRGDYQKTQLSLKNLAEDIKSAREYWDTLSDQELLDSYHEYQGNPLHLNLSFTNWLVETTRDSAYCQAHDC